MFHVCSCLFQLQLDVAHPGIDDTEPQVENQVDNLLAERILLVGHFQAFAQLVSVHNQLVGNIADGDVMMMGEIGFGLESLFVVVLYGLP